MERVSMERGAVANVPLLGDSPAWREVLEALPRIAASELPVLVLGETGTGKELVARELHALSPRRDSAFVAHNCGATPDSLIESELFGHARGAFTGAIGDREGLFDAAHRGTLFLDEIGDASALLQMKLLRVLQEGEARRVGETRTRRLDVRILSATHRRLDQGVGFRSDLLFRLNAVCIELPPLRERGQDVLALARHYLARAAARCSEPAPQLDGALVERMRRHPWPGNVRELANGCAYAVLVAGGRSKIMLGHWPPGALRDGAPSTPASHGLHAETRALEERRLREALTRARWNKSQAARSLGLSRQGLLKKLRRLGLTDAPEAAESSASAPVALDAPRGGP
jgi:transcriptional regulator with GAF, ATPase, and Fis domain